MSGEEELVLDMLIGAPFAVASRLRGARVFHPRGVVVDATWDPDPTLFPGARLTAAPQPALVRVSHAIGLPPGVPDILGLAVRVVDAHGPGRHQDLLFASTGGGPWSRHVLRPASTITRTTLSTLLPYDVAGVGRHPLCAHATGAGRPITYPEVVHDPARNLPDLELVVGAPTPRRLAVVRAHGTVAPSAGEQLCFDPWNTGSELRPAGMLNRLRRPTYHASQRGRGAAA